MPFKKGQSGHPGREVGSKNKYSKTVKENILSVFAAIGGADEMAKWAAENRTEFYRLFNSHKDSDKDAQGGTDNPKRVLIELP